MPTGTLGEEHMPHSTLAVVAVAIAVGLALSAVYASVAGAIMPAPTVATLAPCDPGDLVWTGRMPTVDTLDAGPTEIMLLPQEHWVTIST
jgi:hypothetical protein